MDTPSELDRITELFSRRLQHRRLSLQKRLYIVAQEAGVSYRTWESVESGRHETTLAKAVMMAKALDTTIDALLSEEYKEILVLPLRIKQSKSKIYYPLCGASTNWGLYPTCRNPGNRTDGRCWHHTKEPK